MRIREEAKVVDRKAQSVRRRFGGGGSLALVEECGPRFKHSYSLVHSFRPLLCPIQCSS